MGFHKAMKAFADELQSAFSSVELEQLVRYYLNVRLSSIVPRESTRAGTVFALLQWVEAHGRLGDLLAAVMETAPHNARLGQFARDLEYEPGRAEAISNAWSPSLEPGDALRHVLLAATDARGDYGPDPVAEDVRAFLQFPGRLEPEERVRSCPLAPFLEPKNDGFPDFVASLRYRLIVDGYDPERLKYPRLHSDDYLAFVGVRIGELADGLVASTRDEREESV
jgi:hypothetical protein